MSIQEKVQMMRRLIADTKGRFFSVHFIKKDGSLRKMVARIGVHKYVKGTGQKLSEAVPVIRVFDIQKDSWRSVPLNRVLNFKCGAYYEFA
jgi:hypothetical protein